MSTKIDLADNIKKRRKQLGFTQQDLAVKADLPISVITKIEQGIATQPTIQTVAKIAKALSISLDELIAKKYITK